MSTIASHRARSARDPWAMLFANWQDRSAANANGPVEAAYDSIDGLGVGSDKRSPLDWALFYAGRSMRIFPVKADRKPLTNHGFKEATTDEKQTRAWWRMWTHAEAGWAVPGDIVVVDLDVKHQSDIIQEFERRTGRTCHEIATPQATTPTGGLHLIFKANGHKFGNSVRVDGCAIDLRTEGGYIVLPGADNGRRWLKPLDTPLADAPEWLSTAGKRRAKAAAPVGSSKGPNGAGADDPVALAFLDEACSAIAAAPNGEQEATLHRKCFAVGGLVGAGRLREERARARLIDAANAMHAYGKPWGDLTDKVCASIARGMEQPWSPRPVIEIAGGDLARGADEAEHALARAGLPIFSRNFTLVRPVTEDAPASHNRRTRVTILKPISVDIMIDWLSRHADFRRYDGRSKKMVRVDPPERVARIILARANAKMFPQIAGVITTPTLRPDDSIIEQEGYDAATRLFLTLDAEFKLSPVADRPTREEARAAVDLLRGLLANFPFAGEDQECAVSKAVALSGIMTAVLRGALPTAPMHVFRAHAAGTGKSLLVDTAAAISTGRLCPVIAAGRSEEETEKRLGALLREGAAIISLDNVNGELGGDALAQLTERPLVRVRVLGLSEAPTFECKSAVFATGNNTVVVGDMTRRVLFCTLDAQCERPELREFEFNPIERVLAKSGGIRRGVSDHRASLRRGGHTATAGREADRKLRGVVQEGAGAAHLARGGGPRGKHGEGARGRSGACEAAQHDDGVEGRRRDRLSIRGATARGDRVVQRWDQFREAGPPGTARGPCGGRPERKGTQCRRVE